jgi:putative restriction endonuclease
MRNLYGDALPWSALTKGFEYLGERIPLMGAAGIWKPRVLDLPISIATSPRNPYGDVIGDDGLLLYRYQGSSARPYDNELLRQAMHGALPLIYFHGLSKGFYAALWPAVIVADDPASQTFTVACEDVDVLRPELPATVVDEARRAYVTRLAVARLHQAAFRQRVLRAYGERCTVCRIRHLQLLDAAHILADRHEHGDPVVANGLALCKIHHAAFDANFLGVRPDHVVEIRDDVLQEIDGPMLRHGIQEHHGTKIVVPQASRDRPSPERLEMRYELFRRAG